MRRVDEQDLTAYALNEVDAETAAAVEATLTDRPERTTEIDEVQATARMLSEALATETTLTSAQGMTLRQDQRQQLAEAAAHAPRVHHPWRWAAGLAALVPVTALVVGVTWRSRSSESARMDYFIARPSPGGQGPRLTQEQYGQLRSLGYTDPIPHQEPGAAGWTNTESYAHQTENDFIDVALHPLSTFAMDVDTASYSNVRRFLSHGQRPPMDAVRIEELINYFTYDDEPPTNGEAFAARVEVGPAPWAPEHRLARIGLKAREVEAATRPAVNLVFLVDVSGSMDEPEKLPLVQQTLRLLAGRLESRDHVAIIVYAGAAGLVLPSTTGRDRAAILAAIDRLKAGGSTNGGAGLTLAYATAQVHFIPGGVNRVILATDGDFNVGLTDEGGLVRLVQEKAKQGVFLSALGFGMGNYKDSTLEMLADKGNGNYAYIDNFTEARRALVEQMNSTLITVAKDAKVQVEFNPTRVQSYRLIGYENRLLRAEEFADDRKDGGEVGSGHTVTAIYEIVPAGGGAAAPHDLRYQTGRSLTGTAESGELLNLEVRYKEPDGVHSKLLKWPVSDGLATIEETSPDFRFAAAVAGFGMLLRESPHRGNTTLNQVEQLARGALGSDPGGYRSEFLSLVQQARPLLGTPR